MQRRRQVPESSLELSSDELAQVLQEASQRQGKTIEGEAASLTRVDEVFAIAEELGIPEEHVRAALASHQRKEQNDKRGIGRSLFVAAASGGLTAVGLIALGASTVLAIVGACGIAAATLAVLLVTAAKKSSSAKASGPIPGMCRVCFRPAHTPQSTFCDEHRYRPPAG